MSEGFFSRWSRRKQETLQGRELPAEPPGTAHSAEQSGPAQAPLSPTTGANQDSTGPVTHDSTRPLPTLDDVQALTLDSDFQPFMQSGVGAEVRNAAMKKLFADPHFNVMDGLDIYIDDYSQPDPMPAGMLRQMASAQFLKLVPDPADQPGRHAQDADGMASPSPAQEVVAQWPDSSAPPEPQAHDDPDLQLQPDPATGSPEPGPYPR